jgi:hypothetical protein
VSGGGSGSMARACLSADGRSTGAKLGVLRRHTELRFLRRTLPPTTSMGRFHRQIRGRPSFRTGVCPEKADMFSGGQSHRRKSQEPS